MQNPKGEKPWPVVSLALIERLEATYPDRSPSVDTKARQVWMDAGAAMVVRKLRQVHEKQTLTVLSSS